MSDYYVTFGQRYHSEPHPAWEGVDPDGYVTFTSKDEDWMSHTPAQQMRTAAFVAFGAKFAFLYTEKEMADEERGASHSFPAGSLATIHVRFDRITALSKHHHKWLYDRRLVEMRPSGFPARMYPVDLMLTHELGSSELQALLYKENT